MKKRICFILSLGCLQAQAQQLFVIDKGRVTFTSEAQLEVIRAVSDDIKGRLDPSSNQFAFVVNIRTFKGFNSALQQEHFNEKYMESEMYPNASFLGKIIEPIDYSRDTSCDVRAKGELEIHGQKQTRIIRCHLVSKRGIFNVESDFVVPLSDHNISIPRIITQKIASQIKVNVKVSLIRSNQR